LPSRLQKKVQKNTTDSPRTDVPFELKERESKQINFDYRGQITGGDNCTTIGGPGLKPALRTAKRLRKKCLQYRTRGRLQRFSRP
jgi:hypothetical protein